MRILSRLLIYSILVIFLAQITLGQASPTQRILTGEILRQALILAANTIAEQDSIYYRALFRDDLPAPSTTGTYEVETKNDTLVVIFQLASFDVFSSSQGQVQVPLPTAATCQIVYKSVLKAGYALQDGKRIVLDGVETALKRCILQ